MSELEEEDAFFSVITHVKAKPAKTTEDIKSFLMSANTWLFELELNEEQET